MQIYTKIMIGMLVGVVLGFALGPSAPWLDANVFVVRDPGTITLLKSPGGESLGVTLPAMSGKHPVLRLHRLASRHAGQRLYHQVAFEVTRQVALKDLAGRIKTGQQLQGWVDAGLLPRPVSGFGERLIAILEPVGTLFLRLIEMVIVPLVFASLLVGVASLGDPRRLGRLGGKTLGYFLATTAVAVTIGLTVANVVEPGSHVSAETRARLLRDYGADAQERTADAAEQSSALDNLLAIVPRNPIKSLARGDMLQVIFFAGLFGFALTLISRDKAGKVVVAFEAIYEAMIKIVDLIMKVAPYAVCALVAKVVGESGPDVLQALVAYVMTVLVGLAIHAAFVYTSVVRMVGGVRPIDFWRAVRPAQLIGFSMSSSSAALPVTMECAERNLGISGRIASFVLPLGATVNMDGTAMYQGVAAVFIAQVFDMHLSLVDQLGVVLTATLASIGTAGVPGVGIVMLAMVLTAIGVPTSGVALILGVDRIVDMFRSGVNLTGDMSAAVLLAVTEGERVSYRGQWVGRDPETGS